MRQHKHGNGMSLGMRLPDVNSKTMRWHVCTCMYMGEEYNIIEVQDNMLVT